MTRHTWAKAACIAGTGVLMAGGLTVAMPGTALAARSDCESGANGFIDISNNEVGVPGGPAVKELRPNDGQGLKGRISLRITRIDGDVRGFAALTVPRVGDEAWMDWTTNGLSVATEF
jgi:hypothetical protein